MEGTASLRMKRRIFVVEKIIRGSVALKHCLTKDLIWLSNLKELLQIQGNLAYTALGYSDLDYADLGSTEVRRFIRDKFGERLERDNMRKIQV